MHRRRRLKALVWYDTLKYLIEHPWVCLASKRAPTVLWLEGHSRQLFLWASKLRQRLP